MRNKKLSIKKPKEIKTNEITNLIKNNSLIYNEKNDTFTLKVYSEFGYLNSYTLKSIIDIIPEYIDFIHLTTKQNVEIQNIQPNDIEKFFNKLNKINQKENFYNFISTSYLSGINPKGIFDVLEFSKLAKKTILKFVDINKIHPKFRIGISDSDEDLGLAWFSDIGLIAKTQNGKKGFTFLFGGSIGKIPRKANVLFDFIPYSKALKKLLATTLYIQKFNKTRAKDIITTKGINNIYENIKTIEKNISIPKIYISKPNLKNNLTKTYCNNLKILNPINYQVSFRSQKQNGMFYIETIVDGGDISKDFANLLCHISLKFGNGLLIVNNRQNFIIPNISIDKIFEIRRIFKNFGITEVEDNNSTSNIVACTGKFSCNLAIIDSKNLYKEIREAIGNSNLKINISACPNASGHHHLGDIGIFTISNHRKKNVIFNVIVFGGYGNHNIPIGRAFAKVPVEITSSVIKKIVESYNKSGINVFQEFVKKEWRNLKLEIFNILNISNIKDKKQNNPVLTVREGSFIDKLFLELFDIEFIVYKIIKKHSNEKFYLNFVYKMVCNFIHNVSKFFKLPPFKLYEDPNVFLEKLLDIEETIEKNIEILREFCILGEQKWMKVLCT